MNTRVVFGLICLISINLSFAQKPDNNEPRYGNIIKSKSDLDADNNFILEVVKKYGSRTEAARKHTEFGWDYLKQGDNVTAMKRFNQAWLLDSTLLDIYWGFGAVIGARNQYDQAIGYLKMYYD